MLKRIDNSKGEPPGFSRRTFLVTGAAAGGGLLLGVCLPRSIRAMAQVADETLAPNAFVRIKPDDSITLVMPQVEMGQGTYTSMSMLIAEELEVALEQIGVEAAPPNDKLYANPLLGFQVTGGSTSVPGFWEPLRRAGATARVMLIEAAASQWGVDAASCRAEKGDVVSPTGERLKYGALVEAASKLPVPDKVGLKAPEEFTLIGTPAKRIDTPEKVNGKAKFGIDAMVPGMKFATVAACPVLGGKIKSVDDSKTLAIAGVRQVVRIDNAVAVVGDNMWAAMQGLQALYIEWDEGPNANVTTESIVAQMARASKNNGVVARTDGDFAKALAAAAKKIEAVYEMPFLAHAAMEPMNCTVHVTKDSCDIWVGIQVVSRAQATAAEVTGLPPEKIQVHNHLIGGGFGRRLDVDGITQAVAIARQVEGPVKIVWSREEDIQHDVYRPYYYDRFTAGLDAQNKLIAYHHRVTASSILARWAPPAFVDGLDADAVDGAAKQMPYGIPNILVDYVRDEPPGLTTGWWRGVGPTHNIFVVESFVDELAAETKTDPVEFRRSMLTSSAARARRAQSRRGKGRLGVAPCRRRRARRLGAIRHGQLLIAGRRSRSVEGRRGQSPARRLRRRLRPNGQSRHDHCADRRRHHFWPGRSPVERNYAPGRPRRAAQFQRLSRAADKRNAGHRSPSREERRSAGRYRRARYDRHRSRRHQRHFCGDRQAHSQAPDQGAIAPGLTRRGHHVRTRQRKRLLI